MNDIDQLLHRIKLPNPESHKGQNGKVMIIGGSELFHAASKWSLDVASKFVDMVFYSSVPSNNDLIAEAKQNFWNGIVVAREEVDNYVEEADCILIGPGMTRSEETEKITTDLLRKYASHKWVIDAGALQMIDPSLLTERCIITPHQQEFTTLLDKHFDHKAVGDEADLHELTVKARQAMGFSEATNGCTILLKGREDLIVQTDHLQVVTGGSAGMTKGGTGDVLAGLVAALYATHDAWIATVIASYINKKTGEFLSQKVGPFFNASDLVEAIPQVFWQELQRVKR